MLPLADAGLERITPAFPQYQSHLAVATPQVRGGSVPARQMEPHPQRARGSGARLQYTRGPPVSAATAAPPPARAARSLPHMSTLLQDSRFSARGQLMTVDRRAPQCQQRGSRPAWAAGLKPGSSAHYFMSPVSASSPMDLEDDYQQRQKQQEQAMAMVLARQRRQEQQDDATAAVYDTVRSLQSTPRYVPSTDLSRSPTPCSPLQSATSEDASSSSSYAQQGLGDKSTSSLVVEDEEMPLEGSETVTVVPGSPVAPTEKSSRYLREMDRRTILSRIARGEKQSALAKEYQVSRAAICNLNKHRAEVFARRDGNPLAKHPKKPRAKMTTSNGGKPASRTSSKKWTSAAGGKYTLGSTGGSTRGGSKTDVHEVKSRAAALLLTTLRKKHTAQSDFRRTSERLMRLLMEEALALVPIKTVEIFLSDQSKDSGVALEHPPCAVSMEQDGCPMLELFHLMEPDQPTGYMCFDGGHAASQPDTELLEAADMDAASLSLFDAHLPATLNYHNVFLLDHVATSGARLSAALQCLQERGAVKSMIYIVSLMTTTEVITQVRTQHPGVKMVTAQMDEEDDSDANDDESVGATSSSSGSQASVMRRRLEQVYHTTSC